MDVDDIGQLFLLSLAALLGGLLLLPLLTALLGRLCRLVGLPGGLGLPLTLGVVLAAVAGGSLYLDRTGQVVPGRVTAKTERILSSSGREPEGSWLRQFMLDVAYTTLDGRELTATISVDEERFDGLRPGMPVIVRYLPEVRLIARLADQSTWSLVPWPLLRLAGLIAASFFAIWMSLRLRLPGIVRLTVIAISLIGLLLLLFPTPWPDEPIGPQQLTVAEVRAVRTVTRSFFAGRRWAAEAPQPWQLVELVFVPGGRDQPVVAVDGVDEGTVPGLVVGGRVPINYSPAAPREARLVGGSRTYRAREWQQLAETAGWIIALLAGWWLLARFVKLLWRRRPRSDRGQGG